MFDDGDEDLDFAALAAIEEQALAARWGRGGVVGGVATTTTEKPSNNNDVNGRKTNAADGRSSLATAASSSFSRPPQAVVDLIADSTRENRAPSDVSMAKEKTGEQKAGETVARNVEVPKAMTDAAAVAAAPPLPPPPAPVRHLTLADVSKPLDLIALPWLNAEIKLDRSAARTWLAPVKPAPRPYQSTIAATALLHNTLVCLPTGLGKTMVASIVMANFARWFPSPAKIVFVAPTRPLVSQQVFACASVMGVLRKGEAVELTGSSATPAERAAVWDEPEVRFVFTTPQAFRNDLALGVAPAHRIVCVVVDECHRCVGKSDGAVALRTLSEKLGVAARVVGLSATPGSTRAAVQEVLARTNAARIEFRAEGDACLRDYVHQRTFEKLVVPPPPPAGPARAAACRALRRSLAAARSSAAAAVEAGSRSSSGSGSHGPALSSGTLSLLSTQGLPCDPETIPRATLAAAARRAERAAKEARAAAAAAAAATGGGSGGGGGGGRRNLGAAAGDGDDSDSRLSPAVARAVEAARHLRAAALLAGARDAVDAYGVRGGADYLAAREADATAAGLLCVVGGGANAASSSNCGNDSNPEYRALVAAAIGSGGDPKLAALLRVLEKHFGSEMKRKEKGAAASSADDDENAAAAADDADDDASEKAGPQDLDEDRTRAIVFASLRETVAVVVRNLRGAGYDARPFVGQGAAAAGLGSGSWNRNSTADASGGGGMRQAEQAATLAAFRAGAFPVLVATCVGEEGLDVPAVDLCVCYDAAASPLRGVQRAGRAGRARPGAVVCLLSSGREEAAAAAAAAATAELHAALRAQAFDLARRAPRMLPREFVPTRVDVDLRAGEEEENDENASAAAAGGVPLPAGAASRRNVLSSSRRGAAAAAASAAGSSKGAWGNKDAAGGRGKRGGAAAAASAPPPQPPASPALQRPRIPAAAAAGIDSLLFPSDTAPVVRLSSSSDAAASPPPRQLLVVDPPPPALVAAVEEAEEAAAAAVATFSAAEKEVAKTPASNYGSAAAEKVAAAAARLTQILSVSQRATTGSEGAKRSENNDVAHGGGENLDDNGNGGGDTDNEFGAAGNGWLDVGGWGDDVDGGAGLEGGWDLQQSLSSAGGAGAATASAERRQQQQQQPVTADRRGRASAVAACRQRVLVDSASPALAMPRRRLETSLTTPCDFSSDDSPGGCCGGGGAARPRRLLKKRRTSRVGAEAAAAAAATGTSQQPQQRRAPSAAAAAAAFFDIEAGLSTDGDDGATVSSGGDEEDEDGSFESSFLDGTQPEEEEDGGPQRGRHPRRLSDELAAYRARMVQDAVETPQDDNRRGGGRTRMRRLVHDDDDDDEKEEEGDANESDDYDEDDSFIATARSDGRAPSVAGPFQHNAECGVCGDYSGVSGKGPLLCCARCPTAVHARCISTREHVKSGSRDWLCAVCSDD